MSSSTSRTIGEIPNSPQLHSCSQKHLSRNFVSSSVCFQTNKSTKLCHLPVMSAPSSTSPMASESWKLSSWYRVLPVRVSLQKSKKKSQEKQRSNTLPSLYLRFRVAGSRRHRCRGSDGGCRADAGVCRDVHGGGDVGHRQVAGVLHLGGLHPPASLA